MRLSTIAASFMLLALGTATSQEVRQVDNPQFTVACFDPVRQRIVARGWSGYSHEWDGVAWQMAPDRGAMPDFTYLYFDSVAGHLIALRALAFSPVVRIGNTWQAQVGTTGPGLRDGVALAFDSVRGELVAFGGSGIGYTAVLDETWVFDGTAWQQRNPAVAPSPRVLAGAAFDTARQCVVLFGGYDGSQQEFDETWEWDGAVWQLRTLAVRPPARVLPVMVYDDARQRTVLLGSSAFNSITPNDHWEYDGQSWTSQAAPPATIASRRRQVAVFDPVRSETLVLGGQDGIASVGDVWAFDGAQWSPRPGFTDTPIWRRWASVTTAPAGAGLLLFGGDVASNSASNPSSELWRFDNAAWSLESTGGIPGRMFSVIWSQQGSTFVFGGRDASGQVLGDTWRWDGLSWSQIPGPGPGAREQAAIAYDPIADRAVLLGGTNGTYVLDDTWLFDGANWLPAAGMPFARRLHTMAYDSARQRVVAFGGFGATQYGIVVPLRDTWEWDGVSWQWITTMTAAPPELGSMAFDAPTQRVIFACSTSPGSLLELWSYDGIDWSTVPAEGTVHGANSFATVTPLAATGPSGRFAMFDSRGVSELFPSPALVEVYGSGCGPDAPVLAASTLPQPGAGSFSLEVTNLAANAPAAIAGAVGPANLPFFGCKLLVAPNQATAFLVSSGAGFAALTLPVPAQSSLIGLDSYCQAAALTNAASNGFALSPGLRVRIGN